MEEAAERRPFLGFSHPDDPLHRSEVNERSGEGEQSAGVKGELIEHTLAGWSIYIGPKNASKGLSNSFPKRTM